jgi:pSer/pThr/pTyr-binding forkhead associated (FHA) protein
MYRIICPGCSNPNNFEIIQNRPLECSFCFTTLSNELSLEEIKDENKGKLIGLKLICQNTSEVLTIEGDSGIIGREHVGAKLLSNITVNQKQVISRKHCSLYRVADNYYLKDEGSTNGTFYGINKTDCSKDAQVIEDNNIIFLGREIFLIQFIYEESQLNENSNKPTTIEPTAKPIKFRCNEGCGYESLAPFEICPKCMTSNSMVEIREYIDNKNRNV